MKAAVFGGTGFIGSHVVEQLTLAGHQVTAAVRITSKTTFLENLGVNIVTVDFSDSKAIGNAIAGHEVVYNCTADANLTLKNIQEAPVEITLTKTLIEAAALHGATRFIQLSTIVLYDFNSMDPIDETYIPHPEYPIQHLALEREKIIEEIGATTGITTIVLRPASTIGLRDKKSFFSRLLALNIRGQYPVIGKESGKVSLVDTRDIGRAMAFLGTYNKPKNDNGLYLLKGFDTTWRRLKEEMDHATGNASPALYLPENLTEEQMFAYNLTPFALKSFTVNRIWNDNKIRKLGFHTKYSLAEAVDAAVRDKLEVQLINERRSFPL